MIRWSALIGQDAMALGTARRTGSVTGISIVGSRITTVDVGDETITASAVRSFEGDVLTYDEHSVITHGQRSGRDPRGIRTLDMRGDELGAIVDLEITADGTIESVLLDDGSTIPGARLRAIGTYAAILGQELPPPTGPPIS